jgi:hypothetical protein
MGQSLLVKRQKHLSASERFSDLSSVIPLQVVQSQNAAIAFWQQAEKVLYAPLDLLVGRCCIISGE